MNWKIPLYKIYWDEEDIQNVTNTIRRGMYWASGPNVEKFEQTIVEYVGRKFAVAFNSGTSALYALLLACDFEAGSEVIVPSFTFISSVNTVLLSGARPIFADIEEKFYGLDPDSVQQKITKKTKAILPTHYGGCPCLIKELRKISDDNDILLIEDAAESLGAEIFKEGKVGSFGDAAMFSFCGNKVVTTGEGGLIVTDKRKIYEKLKLIRSHGQLDIKSKFKSPQTRKYITLGCNWRMSDITASLGLSQMKKIDKLIEMRRTNAAFLSSKLSSLPMLSTPISPSDRRHIYQMYTIRLREDYNRDKLREYLSENGIMSTIYFPSIHMNPFYKKEFGCKEKDLLITEEVSNTILTLPMYPSLIIEDMNYMAKTIAHAQTLKS